jgi:asparagine synthase (glutamine-hydrolysing)
MAFGVEGRVPFLDHRVVEFGLALPDEYKIDGKNGKRFLKQWAEQYLPREQLWGKKSGFTVPVNEWLSGTLLDKLEMHLPQNTGIQRWFNADATVKLIQRQRSHGDRSQPLWAMLQFAIWHSMFIEGDGVRPPTEADLFQYIAS